MLKVKVLEEEQLPEIQGLINAHLGAVVPGWSLPVAFIARRLGIGSRQRKTGDRVDGKKTLCVTKQEAVLAVAHLLRRRESAQAGGSSEMDGEIEWVLFRPEEPAAGSAVLKAAQDHLEAWGIPEQRVWATGLPVPVCTGVADVWPHIVEVLEKAGLRPSPDEEEHLHGGLIGGHMPLPATSTAGVGLRRVAEAGGTRFAVLTDGREIASCKCRCDLSLGGDLPALRGWAEVYEFSVDQKWCGKGVLSGLVRNVVEWIREGGSDRVVSVLKPKQDVLSIEELYKEFGWRMLTRQSRTWSPVK